jgi:hypothetical protein
MKLPFVRPLKLGSTGPDVEAVKRATYRALGDSHSWSEYVKNAPLIRRTYGPFFVRKMKQLQDVLGVPETGRYDEATHERLMNKTRFKHKDEPAFDALAQSLLLEADDLYNGEARIRNKIVETAFYGASKERWISYSQYRPMRDFAPPPNFPTYTDCSGFVTWCYKSAGAPDPNGRGYDGYGFTGSLYETGTATTTSRLKPGDLVFYGTPWMSGGAAHVVVYTGGGMAVSHGRDAGPERVSIYYRPIVGCRTYRLK